MLPPGSSSQLMTVSSIILSRRQRLREGGVASLVGRTGGAGCDPGEGRRALRVCRPQAWLQEEPSSPGERLLVYPDKTY